MPKKIVPVEEKAMPCMCSALPVSRVFEKTRGEHYFVNNRFINRPYLNHAVSLAFDQNDAARSFPFICFIF